MVSPKKVVLTGRLDRNLKKVDYKILYVNWALCRAEHVCRQGEGNQKCPKICQHGLWMTSLKKWPLKYWGFFTYQATAIAVDLKGQSIWPRNSLPLWPPSWDDVTHIKGQNKSQRNQGTVVLTEHCSLFKIPVLLILFYFSYELLKDKFSKSRVPFLRFI